MYELIDADGVHIDTFDTDGEALMYAVTEGVKAPFKILPL